MAGRKRIRPELGLGYERLDSENSRKNTDIIGRFLIHTYLRFWMSYDELKGDIKYWKRKMRKKDVNRTELMKYMDGLRKEVKELNKRIQRLGMDNNVLSRGETIGERLDHFEAQIDKQIDLLKTKGMNMRAAIRVMNNIIDSFEEIIDSMKDINVTREAEFTIIKAHNRVARRFFIFPGETPFTDYSEINRIIENKYNKGIIGPYDIYKHLCEHYGIEPYPKDMIDRHLERKRY